MREKRDNSRYAEINVHKDYGYMSTSIWSYEELKEMLFHTTKKPRAVVDEIVDRIINDEDVSFEEKGITSTFRLATDEDIVNAEKDEIEYNKELNDFIYSPHDTSLEDRLLNHLGLDNKK